MDYKETIKKFVDCNEPKDLILNIYGLILNKTKEMILDFRRGRRGAQTMPITIRGTDVEVVSNPRYLGVHLDERLDWMSHMDSV